MKKPKLIIFASGSKTGGGSGFENLVLATRSNPQILVADIVAVVSNHEHGGVHKHADRLGVTFEYFPLPRDAEDYQRIIEKYTDGDDIPFVVLSGWLKLAKGLNPKRTFNIHPGPLPKFGGDGMYGHFVHEAVMESFGEGQTSYSAVSMHFVTEKYDEGPLFFNFPVPIHDTDTPEILASRVNSAEHAWQPYITNLVVTGQISWDGKDPSTLTLPENYPFGRN